MKHVVNFKRPLSQWDLHALLNQGLRFLNILKEYIIFLSIMQNAGNRQFGRCFVLTFWSGIASVSQELD